MNSSMHSLKKRDRLFYAIGEVESNHNPKAKSNKGALGMYQIRACVWEKELKKEGIIQNREDLFNPIINRKAAEYILNKYYKQTRSMRKALIKYSGGDKDYPNRVFKVLSGAFPVRLISTGSFFNGEGIQLVK